MLLPFFGGVWAYWREHKRRRRQHAERVNVVPVGSYRFAITSTSTVKYAVVNSGPDPAYDLHVDLLPWEWSTNVDKPTGHLIAVLPPTLHEVPLRPCR